MLHHCQIIGPLHLPEERDYVLIVTGKINRRRDRRQPPLFGPSLVARFELTAIGLNHVGREPLGKNIIFIGNGGQHDGGIVLIGQSGVGIHVGPDLFDKLLLEFDHPRIENRVGAGLIFELIGGGDAIAALEPPVGQQIHININAFLLEAMDQVIEAFQTAGIQVLGVILPLAFCELENIGCGIVRIHLMKPDQVDAKLRQSACHFFTIGMRGKVGGAIEVGAPETRHGTVFEDESSAIGLEKSVSAGRFFPFKNKRQIHGSIVPRQCIRNYAARGGLHIIGPFNWQSLDWEFTCGRTEAAQAGRKSDFIG